MDDHVGESQLLSLSPFLKAALHHAASVLVRTDLNTILDACVKDKLSESLEMLASLTVWLLWVLRSLKDAQKCLDNMVAMCTLNRTVNF